MKGDERESWKEERLLGNKDTQNNVRSYGGMIAKENNNNLTIEGVD